MNANEQKRAKRMMYLYLGASLLCLVTMIIAISTQSHRTAIAAVLAGGWASRYYASWRKKYLSL